MLKAVIARLVGITTKLLGSHVQQTQTVGPVSKVHTTLTGNKRSAQTSTHQPQSVTQKSSSKASVAPQGTQASLRKAGQKSVRQGSGQSGQQPATPASKSVKRKQKPDSKAALLVTKATSQKPGKKSAPKKRGRPGNKPKTHV